jgi:hypothetical protein
MIVQLVLADQKMISWNELTILQHSSFSFDFFSPAENIYLRKGNAKQNTCLQASMEY